MPFQALERQSIDRHHFDACDIEALSYSRFTETCKASGLTEEKRKEIWDVIHSNYTSSSRYYHNLSHLLCMFDFIKRAAKSGYSLQDPAAVDWAVWLHDVIYVPTSKTNEQNSAELAAQLLLPAGVPAAQVDKVQKYILATADHHHLEGEPDGDLLMDADLAVLGSPLQGYVEYAVAIRKEYSHLPDDAFARGRARVLKSLLDREQLFLTDIGKSACEAAARANMAHEWRLVFGGQLLQANTLEEGDAEGTEDDSASGAAGSGISTALEAAADAAAAAAAAAAENNKECGCR